jgi:hypothetical protein
MPKMSEKNTLHVEPALVILQYKFEDEFGEPCDEWLDSIEENAIKFLGIIASRRLKLYIGLLQHKRNVD